MHLNTINKLIEMPEYKTTAILKMNDQEIHVKLEPQKSKLVVCGDCGESHVNGYHDQDEVVVEDLSLGKRRLYLHVIKRKNYCPNTGRRPTERIDWLEKWKRVTYRFAIQINRLTSITTNQEAGWYLGINDERVYRIDKAILQVQAEQRLNPIPTSIHISVDEVAWKKHHRYLTNVVDVDKKVITWNDKGRKAEVLDRYYQSLGRENCENIQTVTLDGARTYISSTNKYAVNALIVLDRFHVVQKINRAIETVRRNELNKARKNQDEELIELTNCKQRFMLIKNKSKRTDRQKTNLDRLCEINHPIYKGMLLKESLVGVYDLKSEDEAVDYLYAWIDDALESGLKPFEEIAWSLLDQKIEYILNWFISQRSSSISEGFNNKIKRLKRMAYGYKDINYFKLKIHQHCGYLNPRRFPLN